MAFHLLQMMCGLIILCWSADTFIDSAVAIANNMKLSFLLMGLTVVSIGTALPGIIVSIFSAWKHTDSIAIGNAIGSNIANLGLVLGLTALVTPLSILNKTLRREYPILFMLLLLVGMFLMDGELSFWEGLVLLSFLLVFFIYIVTRELPNFFEGNDLVSQKLWVAILWFGVGLVGLFFSAFVMVNEAVAMARYFHVSEVVIGLTILAIGASLPAMAASLTGALKGVPDLAIGNIIGSNLLNLCAVMGLPAVIHPVQMIQNVIYRDCFYMVVVTLISFILIYGVKGPKRISRFEGGLLMGTYFGYLGTLILTARGL